MNARLVILAGLTVALLGWAVTPAGAQRTPPAGSTSSGTAVSRGGDTNSGSSGGSSSGGTSSGSTATARTSSGGDSGGSGSARSSGPSNASAPPAPTSLPGERRATTRLALGAGAAVAPAGAPEQSRPRGTRPATGVAVQRQPGTTPGGAVYYSSGLDSYYYGYGYGGYGYGYYPFYDPFWFPFQYYGDYGYGGYGYGGYGYNRQPVEDRFGSVRLKVKPRDAEVNVDGYYTGRVDDFDGAVQHLDLEPGPHRIEIRASGYQSIIFEVRTIVGRSITYSGEMERVKK